MSSGPLLKKFHFFPVNINRSWDNQLLNLTRNYANPTQFLMLLLFLSSLWDGIDLWPRPSHLAFLSLVLNLERGRVSNSFSWRNWDAATSRSCVCNRAALMSCPAAATAGQRSSWESGKPSLEGASYTLMEILKPEGAVDSFSNLPLCTGKAKGFSWLDGPLHPSHHLLAMYLRPSPVPSLQLRIFSFHHSPALKKKPKKPSILWFLGKGRLVKEDYNNSGRSRVKVTLKFSLRLLRRRIQFELSMLLLPSPRKCTVISQL